ncbi:hypothetical protein R1flu_004243 [Riccia fluitans]|uniref:Uncharacterized protein n=1 Tax=Riccia fluitans TaxID=41844 RepID=A0ABD1YPQ5_9MARC
MPFVPFGPVQTSAGCRRGYGPKSRSISCLPFHLNNEIRRGDWTLHMVLYEFLKRKPMMRKAAKKEE